MSAVNYFTRKGKTWTDQPACVSPVIRALCIKLNDMCSDGEREDLIGPHLFAPVGTNTGDADDQKRAYLCADRAVRVFAPLALEAAGRTEDASKLRALPPIVDRETAKAAAAAAEAAWAAEAAAAAAAAAARAAAEAAWAAAARAARAAARAAAAAAAAARAAAEAAWAAAARAAARAARAAARAAAAAEAAWAAEARAAEAVKRELLQLILDCCAIGTPREVSPTKTRAEVLAMLDGGQNGGR